MNMSLQLLQKPLFGSFALHTQLFLFGSVLFLPLFLEVRCYSLATPELDSHVQLIWLVISIEILIDTVKRWKVLDVLVY